MEQQRRKVLCLLLGIIDKRPDILFEIGALLTGARFYIKTGQ